MTYRIPMAFLLACALGGCSDQPSPAQPDQSEQAVKGSDKGATATAADSPDKVCERAFSCCKAYVVAVGTLADADTACAATRQAIEAGPAAAGACKNSMEAFRQQLAQVNKPVPKSCEQP